MLLLYIQPKPQSPLLQHNLDHREPEEQPVSLNDVIPESCKNPTKERNPPLPRTALVLTSKEIKKTTQI